MGLFRDRGLDMGEDDLSWDRGDDLGRGCGGQVDLGRDSDLLLVHLREAVIWMQMSMRYLR